MSAAAMPKQKELHIAHGFHLPLDVVTQSLAALAKRRAGKSYLARRFAEQLLDAGQQVVIIDPKGDQWGIRSSADGRAPGYPMILLGGEHGDLPLEPGAGEVVANLVVKERASVLIDVSNFRKYQVAEFMGGKVRGTQGFLEALYRLKAQEQYRDPMMLIVDEADAIAPQKPQKGEGEERMLGAMQDIVRRGGQRGIGCFLLTQRSAVLNKDCLSVAPWMRAPIWQGFRGKCLRTMEQIWEQAAKWRSVEQGDGFEFIDLPQDRNCIKTICWQNGMGQWAPIKRIIRHHFDGSLIRLSQKWGEVTVTANHSVYEASGRLARPQDNPELLAVRHINQQRTRSTSSIRLAAPDNCVIEDGYIRWKGQGSRSKLKQCIEQEHTAAFLRFLGAWISEGSVHVPKGRRDSYIVQIANQDKRWLDHVAQDLSVFIGSGSIRVEKSSTPGVWNLCLSHGVLGKWLTKNCGHSTESKRLPDFVFDLKWEMAKVLLEHLVKGDGTTRPCGRWTYVTKSPELAQGIGLLCSLHRFDYSVYRDEQAGVYRIIQLEWYNPGIPNNRVIAEVPHKGYVYDLEIADGYSHNFTIGVGNIVVHNTQSQIFIGLRTIAPQDLEAIEPWFKVHGLNQQLKEVMDTIPSLPTGDAWISSPGWPDEAGIFRRIHTLPIKTFDSMATPKPGEKRIEPKTASDIDMKVLERQMAETIERAKADDPRELKRQIAELKKQVDLSSRLDRAKDTFVETLSEDRLKKEFEKGVQAERRKMAAEFKPFLQRAEKWIRGGSDAFLSMSIDVRAAIDTLDKSAPIPDVAHGPMRAVPQPARAAPAPRRAPETTDNGEVKLASGARRMLAVLAKWYPAAISEGQLRAEAGLRKGGTFDTYKSRLSTAGYILKQGDGKFAATEIGRDAIGSEALDVPQSTADVIAIWRPKLAAGAMRILEALIHYGGMMSKEELQTASGLSEGGTFDTYISRLRTANLILSPERGYFVRNEQTLLL